MKQRPTTNRLTANERTQLLFGPYKPQSLKPGDKTICLYRDCDVIITGWSDAPISWPRCRALEGGGSGSGLLVDEELARAVRHESALAVKSWWRVSAGTLTRWRRSLGVGRVDNEGSRRLIQAAAEAGGAVLRDRELSADEIERRRQTAVQLDLAQHLQKGYHGRWWETKELALLGTLPDEQVAARIDRSAVAVGVMRRRLGIPKADDLRRK